jgi:hypothetical protein
MSMLTTAWGAGMVVGSSLGGLLSEPANKYPSLDTALLRRYPFLLPCLLVSIVCMMGSLTTYFLLPETLPSKARRQLRPTASDIEAAVSSLTGTAAAAAAAAAPTGLHHHDTLASPTAPPEKPPQGSGDQEPRAGGWRIPSSVTLSAVPSEDASSSDSELATAHQPLLPAEGDNNSLERKGGVSGKSLQSSGAGGGMLELLRDNNVRTLVILCSVYAFAAIGMEEIHSVFFATPVQLGGMGWDSSEIGTSLAFVGLLMTLGQTVVYPAFDRRLGALGTFRAACLLIVVAIMAYPTLHALSARDYARALRGKGGTMGDEVSLVPSTSSWLGVVFVALAYKIFSGCGFISMSLLINK